MAVQLPHVRCRGTGGPGWDAARRLKMTRLRHRQFHGRENFEGLRFECRGIQIGDPVDADELDVNQSHKLFSESLQAQEQVDASAKKTNKSA